MTKKINVYENPSNIEALADNYISKGKTFKALRILERMPDSYEKFAMRAEILSDAELILQSNREAYKALDIIQKELYDKFRIEESEKYSFDDAGRMHDVLIQNAYVTNSTNVVAYYGRLEYSDLIQQMIEEEEADRKNIFLSMYKIVSPKGDRYAADKISEAEKYFALGQIDKAYNCYEEALKAKPDDAELYNCLGFIALMTDKVDLAKEHIEKALSMGASSINTYSNAVLLYNILEDEAKKEYYANLLDKMTTNDPVKLFRIAAAFFESRLHRLAKKWIGKYLEYRCNLEIMLLYAQACFNCGDYTEARETLLDIRAAEPENPSADYYLAKFAEIQHNGEKEVDYLPFMPPDEEEALLKNIINAEPSSLGSYAKELIIWTALRIKDKSLLGEFCDKIAQYDNKLAVEIFLSMLIREETDDIAKSFYAEKAMQYGASGPISYVRDKLMLSTQLPLMTGESKKMQRRVYSLLAFDFFTQDITPESVIIEEERVAKISDDVWQTLGADENMKCAVIVANVVNDEKYAANKLGVPIRALTAARKVIKHYLKEHQE